MTPARIARLEGIVHIVILLFMGCMAGAASFVHIHDVTVEHGQPSWIGWTNAVVIELMSIVAGLEIRRRRRAGQPVRSVLVVLLTAVGLSLAAQVQTAQPSVWGWVVAALPALGLLAVVKIVLSRTAPPDQPHHAGPISDQPATATTAHTAVDRSATTSRRSAAEPRRLDGTDQPTAVGLRTDRLARPVRPTGPRTGPDPDRQTGPTNGTTVRRSAAGPQPPRRSGPDDTRTATGPDRRPDLLALGQTIAADLEHQQRTLTRAALIAGIRTAGHTISTDNASALLRQLKTMNGNTTPPTMPTLTE